MRIFENISQLSKRGLLDIPNLKPGSKYEIVQFPEGFVKVEDTESFFGVTEFCIDDKNHKERDDGRLTGDGIISVSSGAWGETFEKQIGRSSCGLAASLGYTRQMPIPPSSMSPQSDGFNAAKISWIEPDGTRCSLKEDDLIQLVEQNGASSFKTQGLTIDQLRDLVLGGSKNFEILRAVKLESKGDVEEELGNQISTSTMNTPDEFENILKHEIEDHGGAILNYHMSTLGQVPGYGHFGLAVALARLSNKQSAYLLLLDPWPETPVAWVPVDAMFKAMNTIDKETGKNRGCLIRKVNRD